MRTYNYIKAVNPNQLLNELKTANLSGFIGINTSDDTLHVMFSDELSIEHKYILDSMIANHVPNHAYVYVSGIISSASAFGQDLLQRIGTSNILAGKTDEEIDSILEHTEAMKIAMALNTGSLKYAKRKLQALTPFDGITADEIQWLISEIDAFLG